MTNWSTTEAEPENGYVRLKNKIKSTGGQCAKCPAVKNITVDHIIPQHFLIMLGLFDAHKEAQNLQLLCSTCNVEKGNILDYTNPKTLPLLKYYVNRWIERHGNLYKEMTTRKITARCLCHPLEEQPGIGSWKHEHWRKSSYVPAKPRNPQVDGEDF